MIEGSGFGSGSIYLTNGSGCGSGSATLVASYIIKYLCARSMEQPRDQQLGLRRFFLIFMAMFVFTSGKEHLFGDVEPTV
jgi:hypothetical protein